MSRKQEKQENNKLEQEKQKQNNRKKEEQKVIKIKLDKQEQEQVTPQTIKNKLKQKVLELKDKGMTYRDIAKIKFKIGGETKGVSISQITKMVQEREASLEEEGTGEIASKVFKMFEKGSDPPQVVIELKLPPKKVNELYIQYNEMKGLKAKFTEQDHIIQQFIMVRNYVLHELFLCPYCSYSSLDFSETNGNVGFVYKTCKIYIDYEELEPKPIPKKIEISPKRPSMKDFI